MDVFSLDANLLAEYTAFARSFTRIRSVELQRKVDELYASRRLWPEPLLQLNPHFEDGGSVRSLVGQNGLSPECAEIFRNSRAVPTDPDKSLRLRRHQEQAVSLALSNKSFVVTTGTGSGKSLCFFIPIVDAVVKAIPSTRGRCSGTSITAMEPTRARPRSRPTRACCPACPKRNTMIQRTG